MHGELISADLLLLDRLGDQRLGHRGGLPFLHGPADAVAAEDVEDRVEVEAAPPRRALQLRDVPRPDLVGALGQELGSRIGGVGELVAALT